MLCRFSCAGAVLCCAARVLMGACRSCGAFLVRLMGVYQRCGSLLVRMMCRVVLRCAVLCRCCAARVLCVFRVLGFGWLVVCLPPRLRSESRRIRVAVGVSWVSTWKRELQPVRICSERGSTAFRIGNESLSVCLPACSVMAFTDPTLGHFDPEQVVDHPVPPHVN